MACAELLERAALDHFQVTARLAGLGPPVWPAGERHVRRITREVEAVDRAAHHLLFPVIVEIGKQRRACSSHRGMDVAVNPRGSHGLLGIKFLKTYCFLAAHRTAARRVPPKLAECKGLSRPPAAT